MKKYSLGEIVVIIIFLFWIAIIFNILFDKNPMGEPSARYPEQPECIPNPLYGGCDL